jgi:polysaccharide deacetylase 2 family uncharacterized protein YibQ
MPMYLYMAGKNTSSGRTRRERNFIYIASALIVLTLAGVVALDSKMRFSTKSAPLPSAQGVPGYEAVQDTPTRDASLARPGGAALPTDAFAYFMKQDGLEVRTFDALSVPPEIHLAVWLTEGAFSRLLESFLQSHSCRIDAWRDDTEGYSFTMDITRGRERVILKSRFNETREFVPKPEPVRGKATVGEAAPVGKAITPGRARVALILDDAGGDGALQWNFLKLPVKLTFAVIPGLANSRRFAEEAIRAGHEVIVHLPMQALENEGQKPGGNILAPGMTKNDVERILGAALSSVPGAVGVNNHQGSLATADRDLMRLLMQSLNARGLFFVDSFTHAGSLGMEEAAHAGMPPRRRDVFIDHVIEVPYIEKALADLVKKAAAARSGAAVGIGHVTHQETLRVLRDALPGYIANGVEFVYVSELP